MNFLKDLVRSCRVPKEGKLSDKTFLHSITVSILSIFLCMIVLSSVTWAWFSDGVSSPSNTIQTQNYTLSISVSAENDESTEPLEYVITEQGFYQYQLDANKTYTVKLVATGTGNNGYCKIFFGDLNPLFTEAIPVGDSAKNPYTFTIQTKSAIEVCFDLRWGTYSKEADITNDDVLTYPLPSSESHE